MTSQIKSTICKLLKFCDIVGICLVVLLSGLGPAVYSGQQCSSCIGIEGGTACQHITDCYDNEMCYMQNYTTTSGSVLFDFGCGTLQTCGHAGGPIFGRRSDDHHLVCTLCCNETSLCNRGLKCHNSIHIATNLPRECSDVKKQQPSAQSGVYKIYPYNKDDLGVSVYCLFQANGNWTVFQRRINGSVDFYRDWRSYKDGFGSPYGEYWLGNDILHELTSYALHDLRIDLEDFEGTKKYAEYTLFHVGDEQNKYRLSVRNYTGNTSDDFNTCNGYSNGAGFSTSDQDNDGSSIDCANKKPGGWWYSSHPNCGCTFLNGRYLFGHNTHYLGGVVWYHFRTDVYYSLKLVTMMIKKV